MACGDNDVLFIAFIPFHTAIDIQIHRANQPVRSVLISDFNMVAVLFMVQNFDLFTNQIDRNFIQSAFKRNTSVLRYFPSGHFSKMVPKIIRSRSQAFHMRCKSFERRLSGCTMIPLMINISYPKFDGLVQFVLGIPLEPGQKFTPYGFKPPFNFTFFM